MLRSHVKDRRLGARGLGRPCLGVLAIVSALTGALRAEEGGSERTPRPAAGAASSKKLPGGPGWAANDACISCHQSEARSWRTSRHAVAATNRPFVSALGREPAATRPFCVDCHAPDSLAQVASEPEYQEGVSCVSCHVTKPGTVQASSAARSNASAPHPVERSAEFSTAAACASCHEFEFPVRRQAPLEPRFAWMQRTVTEHYDGRFSDSECISCHMPEEGGRPSHRFRGGYDEAFVKRALAIEAAFAENGALVLTLSPRGVTHAVPTGDLFRRLKVELQVGAGSDQVATCTEYLGRRFRRGAHGLLEEVSDERVQLGVSTVRCAPRLPGRQPRTGSFVVTYERVAMLGSAGDAKATVESQFVVARGMVDPKAAR